MRSRWVTARTGKVARGLRLARTRPASETSAWQAIVVAAVVALSHLLIDDGTLVRFWSREVKGSTSPALGLMIAIDQTFHVLCLLGAALLASA